MSVGSLMELFETPLLFSLSNNYGNLVSFVLMESFGTRGDSTSDSTRLKCAVQVVERFHNPTNKHTDTQILMEDFCRW